MALRLMDFVSEHQVEEDKALFKEGPRRQDKTETNQRPLYEILKENKDKKDSEFNENFKHRPPKALDNDETEFLEAVESHKLELERLRREEEAEQLIGFQAALASRTVPVDEPRKLFSQQHQDAPSKAKRQKTLPISVKIKPLPKKAKTGSPLAHDPSSKSEGEQSASPLVADKGDCAEAKNKSTDSPQAGLLGLGSYGEDSDEEND